MTLCRSARIAVLGVAMCSMLLPSLPAWAPPGDPSPQPTISTVAGNGVSGYSGDGGPATQAMLSQPYDAAYGNAGELYIADYLNRRVRRVGADGIITTVAGPGTPSGACRCNGLPATDIHVQPASLTVYGNSLYIAEGAFALASRVDLSTGKYYTIAGGNGHGFSGDGGPATQAKLGQTDGIAIDRSGNIYLCDTTQHRVRKIATNGIITTVAGLGSAGATGDGGPATLAQLDGPGGVGVDRDGNLYIADSHNHRVRKVDRSGLISTVAGVGLQGSSGDGGPAILARLYYPQDVIANSDGTLYIGDHLNWRVRRVTPNGTITTFAGTGYSGQLGDGGPATSAKVPTPFGLGLGGDKLFVASLNGYRVRAVTGAGSGVLEGVVLPIPFGLCPPIC